MRPLARLRGAFGLAVALAALLAAPAAAWGGEGFDLVFHLAGTNGYRITVGGRDVTAFISTSQPSSPSSRSAAWSTYFARGRVSPTAIHATFGNLGSVAMRFHPSGRDTHSRPQRGCRGPDRYTIRFGVFVGSVRFRGEDGYTSVEVHRVKGRVVTPPSLDCSGLPLEARRRQGARAAAERPSAKLTRLDAAWRSGLTATYFSAATNQGKARFLAATEQSEGSLAVYRAAFALASPLTFASDDALSFASVTPPAPFSGTGSLQRSPDGTKVWTGSLAVSFPGAPNVPLTGPQFLTRLSRQW